MTSFVRQNINRKLVQSKREVYTVHCLNIMNDVPIAAERLLDFDLALIFLTDGPI